MPLLDYRQLSTYKEHCVAFMLLSFIGSGYVWQDGKDSVPKVISMTKEYAIIVLCIL